MSLRSARGVAVFLLGLALFLFLFYVFVERAGE